MLKWIPGIGFASLVTAVWIVGAIAFVAALMLGAFAGDAPGASQGHMVSMRWFMYVNVVALPASVIGVWLLVPFTRIFTPDRPQLNARLFVVVGGLPVLTLVVPIALGMASLMLTWWGPQ